MITPNGIETPENTGDVLFSGPIILKIKVENNLAVDDPCYEGNLLEVFGEVPEGYEDFIRFDESDRTPLGLFEVHDETAPKYLKFNNIWTDNFARRSMNSEERASKEAEIRQSYSVTIERSKLILTKLIQSSSSQQDIDMWNEVYQQFDTFEITDYSNIQLPSMPAPFARDENGKKYFIASLEEFLAT